MNFVIKLLFNKYKNVFYDVIFVIINRYIKIIKYLFIFIIIDIAALTKLFFIKTIYRYDMSYNIVNNRNFIFTTVF